jgi:hypothetical protein
MATNERGQGADSTRNVEYGGRPRWFISDPLLTGTLAAPTVSKPSRGPNRRSGSADPCSGLSSAGHRSAATAPVERLDNGRSRHAARTITPLRPMKTGSACGATRVAAQARIACGAPERTKNEHTMMSRTATASYAGRASSMRRLRRRATAAHTASGRPFCRTNGCASFLEVDPSTGIATCPVCGATQRRRARRTAH